MVNEHGACQALNLMRRPPRRLQRNVRQLARGPEARPLAGGELRGVEEVLLATRRAGRGVARHEGRADADGVDALGCAVAVPHEARDVVGAVELDRLRRVRSRGAPDADGHALSGAQFERDGGDGEPVVEQRGDTVGGNGGAAPPALPRGARTR
jgi:hypothetical protein